ncbi:ATP-dependent helicase, partial [bacterium]|nr:ATP-dependent helicase [bacterium]
MKIQVQKSIDSLNLRQREAVEIASGPLLIVAGAGSGKTRTLTVKIAHLIENLGVRVSEILALTFTNKAAGEMRDRMRQMTPENADRITITTFHSFGAMLLRRWHDHFGYPAGFTIFDDDDQERLMKAVISEVAPNSKEFTPRKMMNFVSQAKNDLLFPDEFNPPHLAKDVIRAAYRLYQEKLKLNSALDFDDLIFATYHLLKANPELLSKLHERYSFFLVDEYQDTNFAQYRLLEILSKISQNICVVGDEDQSIYGWRGANIR